MFFYSVSLSDVTAHITPTSVTSPVSTAAKAATSSVKALASSEPDVAFPAVLKGSHKQRVPPPVPPRGSPKAKRGGAHSQSSIDTKGDYPTLSISVNDIPPPTPITSSDDDFCFYGHDFKAQPAACRIAPSASEQSVRITKLVASNSFLDYAEEGDSITHRSHPGKDLIAQSTMMAEFNIDRLVREHLDSGDYDDTSMTESSSEEKIVIEVNELFDVNQVRARQSKSPSQFIKGVVTQIGDKITRKNLTDLNASSEKVSCHNVKSSDLISAAKTLKKTKDRNEKDDVKDIEKEIEKNGSKPGIIFGITKKLNFNQSKKDKSEAKKIKPKVEIRTYIEGRSKGGMTKDEVICHKKAKTKIDMFQKHIWKVQTDSENSSRRSSISSSQDSRKSEKTLKVEKQIAVKETKKIFERIAFTHGSLSSVEKRNFRLISTAVNPNVSKGITGNVHDKIRKFSEATDSDTKEPVRAPRQKKKLGSFKKRSSKKKIYKMRKDIEEVL